MANRRAIDHVLSGCTGSSCAELTYTYDRAGMRLSEVSSIDDDPANGTAAFTYDALGRLVTDDAPGSVPDQAYDWAAVLDREAKTTGATTVTTSFDAADRPVSDSAGGSYDHDLDGRLTAKPGQTLEWDSLGRLVRVRDGSGAVLSAYTYDALDRLREVTSGGTTIRHRYVGTTTRLAQLWNVTANSSDRNLSWSMAGTLLGDLKPGLSGRRYFGTNAHGDIAWSANASAAVNASLRLDPWGTSIGSAGDIGQLRFQASWRDPATGLSWAISRWYAPDLGAFVSEDSLLGEPINPDSRHLRAYGLGDPVGMVDVDGRQATRRQIDKEQRRALEYAGHEVAGLLAPAVVRVHADWNESLNWLGITAVRDLTWWIAFEPANCFKEDPCEMLTYNMAAAAKTRDNKVLARYEPTLPGFCTSSIAPGEHAPALWGWRWVQCHEPMIWLPFGTYKLQFTWHLVVTRNDWSPGFGYKFAVKARALLHHS